MNHFPVYEPSAERVAAIDEAFSEANNPLGVHYDASAEVRAKGAGFYQFSGDEETRRAQMEELKDAREETERARREQGAEDLRPGEAEGLANPGSSQSVGENPKSRAMEKRKRELEERRKAVDAKRRKVKGASEATGTGSGSGTPLHEAVADEDSPAPVFVAGPVALDPFAALEAQAKVSPDKGKGKGKAASLSAAEEFLAELQHEMSSSK